MGQDKALYSVGEKPMSMMIADKLREAGFHKIILVSKTKLALPLPQIYDKHKAQHPLYGVHTALVHCIEPLCLITPCDLPFVSAESYRRLLAQKQTTVVSEKIKKHPLLGIFSSSRSDEALLYAQKHRSVMSFVQEHNNIIFTKTELRNINHPHDIEDSS